MKAYILAALIGYATAECPNACSGHGTCGAKDACSCYQNYQGNDCSERTCYFGIAHVDTPKGDLNADGFVSGPLTTVITGSEVYPWGTTEQYPNADANEGHFYMECSNKGICDRKTGTCDCFDGYEGTACVRASCPNDCSGHGTCESIKELAELKHYDTTAHDVPATTPVGSSSHHNFNSAIEESYAYDLWDQDKTMGCKCDAVYYGADCSLKKCKYGVDPLFYDNTDGVIYQTTVVHLGSTGGANSVAGAAISGYFRIIFYDVFGERYVTKPIQAKEGLVTASEVKLALQALPNGVIQNSNSDVTGAQTDAVWVSKQDTKSGSKTTTGSIGAGSAGETGAGLGVGGKGSNTAQAVGTAPAAGDDYAGYGPEFTITFSTNPGILKSIELDTRQINNLGAPEYWVANMRQGQFSSRYITNLGRVQALRYGSTKLYTSKNVNLATSAAAGTMVKIGGQELRVTSSPSTHNVITLSDVYLGATISPVITDTGAVTGDDGSGNTWAKVAGDHVLYISATGNTIISNHLKNAQLYVGTCSIDSNDGAVANTDTSITIYTDHDCPMGTSGWISASSTIYRRSDNPSNQNLYKSGDTSAAWTSSVEGTTHGSPDVRFMNERGSSDLYVVERFATFAEGTPGTFTALTVDSFTPGTGDLVLSAEPTSDVTNAVTSVVAGEAVFINGVGPILQTATAAFATATVTLDNTKTPAGYAVGAKMVTGHAGLGLRSSHDSTLSAGNILALSGRRYKVKSIGSVSLGGGVNLFRRGTLASINHKISLTETYASSGLEEICSSCITAVSDANVITTDKAYDLQAGDTIFIGGYVHEDLGIVVKTNTATTDISDIGTTVTGYPFVGRGNSETVVLAAGVKAAIPSPVTLAMYRKVGGSALGFTGTVITESSSATTFQYVSQCSNRGLCDSSTGLCKCFKGYSADNCHLQNMLAM